jgi:hypothetical protein
MSWNKMISLIKKSENIKVGESVEIIEALYTANGKVKGCSH